MDPRRSRSARPAAALALAALLAPAGARAEFATVSVQLLHGWNFDDDAFGYAPPGGQMTTVAVHLFNTWAHGDNFAFVDMYRGDFSPGVQSTVYTEWHPRLFLDGLLVPQGRGVVKHWGLAGEIDAGPGFYAYLGGLGLDLRIPGFTVAGLNVYYRYDNFNESTWQASAFWTVPFSVGRTSWLFTGYADLMRTAESHLDVQARPELLLDVLALAGRPGKLHVGVDWYLHRNADTHGISNASHLTSAPQVMLQWTTF